MITDIGIPEILPPEAVLNPMLRTKAEERLAEYERYERLIHDPDKGMLAEGFTESQLVEAQATIDQMIDFYEEFIDTL